MHTKCHFGELPSVTSHRRLAAHIYMLEFDIEAFPPSVSKIPCEHDKLNSLIILYNKILGQVC